MTLRAGEVAERAGVNLQTLRYYERRGILSEPDRSLGGHRLYDDDTVLVLQVVKAAQALGFSLDEIAELMDIGSHAHRRRPRLADSARANSCRCTRRSAHCSRSRQHSSRRSRPDATTWPCARSRRTARSRSRPSRLAPPADRG